MPSLSALPNSGLEPRWLALERLAAQIQSRLSPGARVEHNQKIRGACGELRQVDVAVRITVDGVETLTIFDAKDYRRRVDIGKVESFLGLMTDVGADHGAIVSPRGFTRGARARAKGHPLDLLQPVDTENDLWPVTVSIRALARVRRVSGLRFHLVGFDCDPNQVVLLDHLGNELGTPLQLVQQQWTEGHRQPPRVGVHSIELGGGPTFARSGGLIVPLRVWAEVYVCEERWFGRLPVDATSGFRDEQTDGFRTNALRTGWLSYEEICSTWQLLTPETPLPQGVSMEIELVLEQNDWQPVEAAEREVPREARE